MSKKNTPRLHSVQLARETLIRKMNYLRKIWSKLHLGRQNHFWDISCLQESWQAVSKSLVLLNTCLPHSPIGPRSAKLPNWQWTLDWWIDSFNVENNFVTSNMLYRQKKFICHYQLLICSENSITAGQRMVTAICLDSLSILKFFCFGSVFRLIASLAKNFKKFKKN